MAGLAFDGLTSDEGKVGCIVLHCISLYYTVLVCITLY